MRILLTSNASHLPPRGGSTRSNLIWLSHLVSAGYECEVVCPTADPGAPDREEVDRAGIRIHAVRDLTRRASALGERIEKFQPDWVLVSSEDVAHVLLREAFRASPRNIVYLAHTPQFFPFGPASWNPDTEASRMVGSAAGIVVIGEHMASYIKTHLGRDASVIHPPMYGEPPYPHFGSFDSGSVLMINPSVVKGITIFLALADAFPEYPFAGLAGWATTKRDRQEMARRPNITVLETVPHIEQVLERSRLLLMPSIWYEGFGLIAMESMLRGLPVIASDSGGLQEAKKGTGFVVPVRLIRGYEYVFDENHMPRAIEPEQEIEPWVHALRTLLTDRQAYEFESKRSRDAGLAFVSRLKASDFEAFLTLLAPSRVADSEMDGRGGGPKKRLENLTPAQRALLLQKLKQRKA